ncbi:hypothetical protein CspeluHIS016_0110020 [Cutaneotrichosporon spelunceum]|uniref:Uncharacterized protein n=1 Tax=Cutaneotrichosporon spelunceum TaxID=1672016 RepID=A0AAD3TP25_9TREE|nr:hypothetical protein CspeluHIS016_0110020 [Cutaneotrichosporon spelunceum]
MSTSMSGSEHTQAIPDTLTDEAIYDLVSAFEAYDFRNDQEFRAGLPAVLKGRGVSVTDIDDVIARAQWFYFTRKQQSQVPFDVYLRYRSRETESVPMGSSVPSTSTSAREPPPPFQDPSGTQLLAVPSDDPPPLLPGPPNRFDTDGEGGITVERVCTSLAASRNPTPPPRDQDMGIGAPSTGGSALATPGLTESSEPSTPNISGLRIENRVAVAAEMAVPASNAALVPEATSNPGPIETTAPAPDGPQLPFDEVVRLISAGRAAEVPHRDVPEGLNETPASEPKLAARPKPWERAGGSADAEKDSQMEQ